MANGDLAATRWPEPFGPARASSRPSFELRATPARADHGKRSLWVTPIGGYGQDDEKGSRTLVLLVPPIFTRHDRTSALHIITPLFIRYRSGDAGSSEGDGGATLGARSGGS